MPLNINMNATLSDTLAVESSGGSIILRQTSEKTIVHPDGDEEIITVTESVTLSYMDVTKLVEFARAAGWRSERKRTTGEQ